jgi:hypothetical protein
MKMLLFNYSPELDKRITNLSALPQGGGCTLLECTLAHDGYTLIAKQWRKASLTVTMHSSVSPVIDFIKLAR